ncbi:MAG: CDP-glycerol glycerophosphotransferase family protein, partial [Blautia sp.]
VRGKWKRKIYFGGGKVLSVFNKLIPKDAKRICFFCKSGLDDNSEALFLHLRERGYQKKYRIYCVVDHPGQYRHLEEENIHMISVGKSLWQLMRSRFLFCHGEMLAIMPTGGQVSVNYWHGTPLKKINGMLDKLGDYRYDFFTYITAAAPMFRPVFAQAFGCEEAQVLINGHPRNDYLFRESRALERLGLRREDYRKIFLWMPTYRRSRDGYIQDTDQLCEEIGSLPLFSGLEDLRRLNGFLEQHGSYLFLKMHPAQDLSKLDVGIRSFDRICFLTNEDMRRKKVPLYSLVREADALITDYSSVYFDYLLLDRPIAFVLEDLGSYRGNRGFVVERPLDYMPGEKIYQKEELFSFLLQVEEGEDGYRQARAQIRDQVNYYQDGKNCERLLQLIHLQ